MSYNLTDVIEIVKSGGCIFYPTETAYALGCDASNSRAIKKVFTLKKRSLSKTSALIVSSMQHAEEYAFFSNEAKRLAKKFWPGPLTLILPCKTKMPQQVVNKNNELALRVSSHPVPTALTKKIGKPLVATSANVSGDRPCYSLTCVRKQFKSIAEGCMIDGGALPKRKVSTIVRVTKKGNEVLRTGDIIV